jgi:predicted dehydrogenase
MMPTESFTGSINNFDMPSQSYNTRSHQEGPALQADKLGVALVGLGKYSTEQLAPALKITQHCYLAGIVTGSPGKAAQWKRAHGLSTMHVYNYDNFDEIADNSNIDIVYVALPNFMHAEYVVRAAKAGKHVICEKPLGLNQQECQQMIEACARAGTSLSVGYRLHFEPHHRELMRLARESDYGQIASFRSAHGSEGVEGWRIEKSMAGGGPLMDLGIYCVQAACYCTPHEPIAVRAQEMPKKHPDKFINIEEGVVFQLEFPDGLVAQGETSYSEEIDELCVVYARGWAKLEPAFDYGGLDGSSSSIPLQFKPVNQQALQLDAIAAAIKQGLPSPVPGEMGKRDLAILEAIYRAMASGEREMI